MSSGILIVDDILSSIIVGAIRNQKPSCSSISLLNGVLGYEKARTSAGLGAISGHELSGG